ncbi:MAG: tripartite tricarboxylate transporter substrate binding protein [Betaproteobacteria bacterium]
MSNFQRLLVGMAAAFGVIFSAGSFGAQVYPNRPIRVVVGFPPGGAVDFIARLVAQNFSEKFGQPVVVENRPGAGSSIGTERVARSAPDGHTLLLMAISGVVQAVLRDDLPYNLQRDLAPISLIAIGQFVLAVHPAVAARNVTELVALARAQPGKMSYSASGKGDSSHLAAELFALRAEIKLLHVPYRGSAEAVVATAAAQVPISFTSLAGAVALIDAGKLRPLAVSSSRRASLLPSIPTLDESGLTGYDYSTWYGMLAPAGTNKSILEMLSVAVGQAARIATIKEALLRQGFDPHTNTPEQFSAFIQKEIEQNRQLIKTAGVTSG